MRRIKNAAHHFGIRDARVCRCQMQIHAVDFVFQPALRILQAIQHGIQRRIHQIIHVLSPNTGYVGFGSKLRPCDANHVAPHFVELYVFAHGLRRAKQAVFCSRAQNAYRCGCGIVRSVEEASFRHTQMANLQIARLDAINDRRILLRLRKNLRRREALARSCFLYVRDILPDDLIIPERKARRNFPDFLKLLVVARFLGFYDQVAHAQLLDERHHLLLRSRADRKHCDHRRDTENHSEHGQQRTQLVAGQVLQAKSEIGQPLFQGSRLSHRTRFHRRPIRFNWNLHPSLESRCRPLLVSRSVFCLDSPARQLFRPEFLQGSLVLRSAQGL